MKNKTTKIILNSVLLAGIAALGITVYQLGTKPKEDHSKDPVIMQTAQKDEEETPLVDAGTSQVKADVDDLYEDDFDDDDSLDVNGSADGTAVDSDDDADRDDTEDDQDGDDTDSAEDTFDMETASTSAAVAAPEVRFTEDTLMEWPVNGNILVDYSMDQTTYFATLDQYKLSPAISVQAVEGAPVMAAANGTVYEIKEDAVTGTTVTMELGNGYQAIYGQLKDLAVSQGETVKEGTIIGYINAPTKYYSREGSNLYFAMKKDGKPIDPITYLP